MTLTISNTQMSSQFESEQHIKETPRTQNHTTVSSSDEQELNDVSNVIKNQMPFSELAGMFSVMDSIKKRRDDRFYEIFYRLLAQCYDTYLVLKNPNATGHKIQAEEIQDYIKTNGLNFGGKTKLLSKIIRCALHDPDKTVDNRKVNAYYTVIAFAEMKNIPPSGLAAFIKENNGLQNTRLQYYDLKKGIIKKVKRIDRIALAQEQINKSTITSFNSDALEGKLGKLDEHKTFILFVTKLSNGKISINGAIKDQSRIATGLDLYYDEHKATLHAKNPIDTATDEDETSVTTNQQMTASHTINGKEINLAQALANKSMQTTARAVA